MRILFASPHRDLNECYQTLLTEEGRETVTAFDGPQTLTLLKTSPFDLLILDQNIPRVTYGEILHHTSEAGTRSILLMDTPGTYPSTASISYPFLPEELFQLISEVTSHDQSAE